jgi:hypothetical protein
MKVVPSGPFNSSAPFGLIWLTRDFRTVDDWAAPVFCT